MVYDGDVSSVEDEDDDSSAGDDVMVALGI
jgi:hypothetical protein